MPLTARERVAVRVAQARGVAPTAANASRSAGTAAAVVPGGWFGGWLGVSPWWQNSGAPGGGRWGVTDGSDATPGEIGECLRLVAPDINFPPDANYTVTVTAGTLSPGDWACQAYAYVDSEVTGAQFYLTPVPPGLSDSMGAVLALQGHENITLVGPLVRANVTVPTILSFSCSTNNDGPGTAPGVMSVRLNAWRMR